MLYLQDLFSIIIQTTENLIDELSDSLILSIICDSFADCSRDE